MSQVRFVCWFTLLLVLFGLAQLLFPEALLALAPPLAHVVAAGLRAVGLDAVGVDGAIVRFAGVRFEIVPECLAFGPIGLFCAFCLAFPVPFPRRIAGAFTGAVLLGALNVIRLVACGVVLARMPAAFPFVHDFLWQAVMVGAAVALAWIWLRGRSGGLMKTVRFLAGAVGALLLVRASDGVVLWPSAFLAASVLRWIGLNTNGFTTGGSAIGFPAIGVQLADPYVLSGFPLLVALWCTTATPHWRSLRRFALAAGLLLTGGAAEVLLTTLCIVRGETATLEIDSATELAAFLTIAFVRVLPILAWISLEPTTRAWLGARLPRRPFARAHKPDAARRASSKPATNPR